MFGRGTLFLLLLLAAVVVPYVLSDSTGSNPLSGWWDSLWTDTVVESTYPGATASPLPNYGTQNWRDAPSSPVGSASPMVPPSLGSSPARPGEWQTVRVLPPSRPGHFVPGATAGQATSPHAESWGPRVQNGTDLIRFDLTPDWVIQQWPRVSTHLREGDLNGMRVAMVSGTGLRDLAGSLTFYFDQQQVMQRLIFEGSTGDSGYLVQDLTRRFGLARDASAGSHVYTRREGKLLTGWLRVIPAPIVRASQPFQRFTVQLELTRPESGLTLTARFAPKLEELN